MTPDPNTNDRRGARTLRTIGALIAIVMLALLIIGMMPRLTRQRQLAAEASEVLGVPVVTVKQAAYGDESSKISLPATLYGLHETGLYAQTSGYVRAIHADMGTHVRAGQTLAEIETPELDQQLGQARANLDQVLSTGVLAKATLDRWKSMVQQSAATRQELDEKQAAFDASAASAAASRANLDRLTALKKFAAMIAPFSGVVTARNIDVGALLSPGTGAGTRPLFTLVQVDTLRILTAVPQNAAPSIRIGQVAQVLVQELGSTTFPARVTRTSQSIDPVTRTLNTELQLDNRDGRLMPGMFANLTLTLSRAARPLLIPANALMIRANGPIVAAVVDNRVHLLPVTLGRDFGSAVEILSGLTEGAMLVVNPGDAMVEGATVRVAPPTDEDADAKAPAAATPPRAATTSTLPAADTATKASAKSAAKR